MQKGDSITLTKDTVPWYSGYGANPYVVLPAGLVGTVTHTNVPPVQGRKLYNVACFEYEGQSWQVSC